MLQLRNMTSKCNPYEVRFNAGEGNDKDYWASGDIEVNRQQVDELRAEITRLQAQLRAALESNKMLTRTTAEAVQKYKKLYQDELAKNAKQ